MSLTLPALEGPASCEIPTAEFRLQFAVGDSQVPDAQTRAVLNSLGIEQSESAGNGAWLNVFMWVHRTVARLTR